MKLSSFRDFFVYCIFGALATLVNMLSYELLYKRLGLMNVPSTALSWFLAVTFAFFTNKFIVFRAAGAREARKRSLMGELGWFYACRASSGVLDVVIMFIAVDLLSLNHTLWKFISNLVVGLFNYIAGKFFIFR